MSDIAKIAAGSGGCVLLIVLTILALAVFAAWNGRP